MKDVREIITPSLIDCEVIAQGNSYFYDGEQEEYIDHTNFIVVEHSEGPISYDSEIGYADIEHIYIIKHPDQPEHWRFRYVYSSWDSDGIDQLEQVEYKEVKVMQWVAV